MLERIGVSCNSFSLVSEASSSETEIRDGRMDEAMRSVIVGALAWHCVHAHKCPRSRCVECL